MEARLSFLNNLLQYNPQKAVELLEGVLRSDASKLDENELPEFLDLLAEGYRDVGRIDESKITFEKALALSRTFEREMYVGQLSQGSEAVEHYAAGLELLRNDDSENGKRNKIAAHCAVAELYLTDLCEEADAEAECERAVRAALSLDDANVEALQCFASLKLSQCKAEESKKAMQRVFDLVMQAQKNEENERSEMLDVDDDGSGTDFLPVYEFRTSTARLLLEVDMAAEARVVLERLVLEDDEICEVWILLGHATLVLRDYDASKECCDRASTLIDGLLKESPQDEEFLMLKENARQILAQLEFVATRSE